MGKEKLRRRHYKNNEINPRLEPVKPRPHPQKIFPYDHIFQFTVPQLVKKIPVLCRIPRCYFQVHNNPSLLFILIQTDPAPPIFFKTQCNTALSSTTMSSNRSFSLNFAYHNFVCTSLIPHAYHFPCPSHPPSFDHPNISRRSSISEILVMKFSNCL